MSSQSSQIRPTTIIAASVAVAVTGFLAYAIYFDHRRRTDIEFRKALKRESKKSQRAAKEEAEAQGAQQKKAIRAAVDKANEEGFPRDPDEVEGYFMQEVARGRRSDPIEAALCFYRALKVYPQPKELINIYDKTVPKPILDILAEMIAVDTSIPVRASSVRTGSDRGSDSGSGLAVDE
ncbi:mitochondrial import receptor subunit tom20 [Coniosporium tulheliwenetii]|uniref:Mitochondrial import receptor subunit tom20 n=1 Tax=Coniosporium tulheliwenetii TaxID=3383036 RepID=A0ACC2ZAB1_9PEZI|nr:mitochondrial import receptor subunit tom20 [Cladosporium sp. JES 115]